MTNAAKKPGIGADAPSFGELIRNSAKSAIQSLRGGEKAQAQAVTGKATLTDVVEAVTAAEMTLQSVVAIRDRMIGAYQEIMRMPI
ncbi:MAG: flagellar hook-basal body complex protein FliE [Alphaproteobacteria bacterium]|nr:flagellar hook-basal body complex protein FliE [Alphaproteobacteria bacterium]